MGMGAWSVSGTLLILVKHTDGILVPTAPSVLSDTGNARLKEVRSEIGKTGISSDSCFIDEKTEI